MRTRNFLAGTAAILLLAASGMAHAYESAFTGGSGSLNPANALLITTTTGSYTVANIDSGFWLLGPGNSVSHDADDKRYTAGSSAAGLFHDYFAFNLGRADISGDILSASFRVYTYGVNGAGTFTLWDVASSIDDVTAPAGNGADDQAIFADLGSGSAYGGLALTAADSNSFITIAFAGTALTAIDAARYGDLAFGGSFVATPIPEPGAGALLLAGLAVMGALSRRR